MILTKEVEMTWNGNKSYYINKGYKFTKRFDTFMVKVEDLTKGSHSKIKCKCDICGEEKEQPYKEYLYCLKYDGLYYCQKCSIIKQEKIMLKLYGNKNPFKSEHFKSETKKTCLKKYGVEYTSQSNLHKEQSRKTRIIKYGKYCKKETIESKEKRKKTCIERYGVENPMMSSITTEKVFNTMIERYGDVFWHNIPNYNILSINYLDIISKQIGLKIQHALNGGEKRLHKYYVDGYINELNIAIEVDEQHHKRMVEKDLKREQYIKEHFGCTFIRLDWKNIDQEVERAISIINDIKKQSHMN